MPPDDLYPRWYLIFSGFVWGFVFGVADATLLYESQIWHLGDFWWVQSFPLLVNFTPVFFLAFFEVFFRVKRHLRLQRRLDASPPAA